MPPRSPAPGPPSSPPDPAPSDEDVRRTAAAAARPRRHSRRSACCATSTSAMRPATTPRCARPCAGHEAAVIHGIHALAVAAARDEQLRYATAAFDPVLLPTRTRSAGGNAEPGDAQRRRVVDAGSRTRPARQGARGRAARSWFELDRAAALPRSVAAPAPARHLPGDRSPARRPGAERGLHGGLGGPVGGAGTPRRGGDVPRRRSAAGRRQLRLNGR